MFSSQLGLGEPGLEICQDKDGQGGQPPGIAPKTLSDQRRPQTSNLPAL